MSSANSRPMIMSAGEEESTMALRMAAREGTWKGRWMDERVSVSMVSRLERWLRMRAALPGPPGIMGSSTSICASSWRRLSYEARSLSSSLPSSLARRRDGCGPSRAPPRRPCRSASSLDTSAPRCDCAEAGRCATASS